MKQKTGGRNVFPPAGAVTQMSRGIAENPLQPAADFVGCPL
jgi:hypothetical protein